MNTREFVKALFKGGKEKGIMDMEVFIQAKKKLSIKVFKGNIDDYNISDERGLSFRGVYNDKMGYSYTEKIDDSSIDMLIKEVIDNAKVIDSDDEEYIFEGSKEYEKLNSFNEDLEKVSNVEKVNFTKLMEEEALKADEAVQAVNDCIFAEEKVYKLLINTKGLDLENKSNIAYAYVSVMVKDGEAVKTAWKYLVSNDFKDFGAKALALEAVKEGKQLIGAKSIQSDNYPIILRNDAAANLLEAYSTIFSAENVQKGLSKLNNRIDERIANDIISLVDDPFMKGGVASKSFDGEGVAAKRKKIIEKGILKTYLHNLKTAKKDGIKSTGNGYKGSYKSPISIAPSNMYIEKGRASLEEMISTVEKGIMIIELQGLHSGVNTVSGDFSLSAHGFLIEKGKISRPVNQITIAGNFYDILKSIIEIGTDLKFALPGGVYIGSPSLKIKELSVSGE